MKTGFCVLLFFILTAVRVFVFAQQNETDTIHLSPVEITAGSEQMNKYTIPFLTPLNSGLTSVTEKLKLYSPVFIKEYSPGGISTVTFRGTGAAHTLVLFDGFPVNPVMSGQADLSALPPYLYDYMEVIPSPDSYIYNASAPGGIISLQTKADNTYKYHYSIRAESGSFGNYGGGLQLSRQAGRFLFRSRAYYHQAENDFSFLNNALPDMPLQYRINSFFRKKGLMQEVFRTGKSSVAFLKFTGLIHENGLPAPLLQPQLENNEMQKNKIFRIIGGYSKSIQKHFLSLKGHLATESWHYENVSSAIISENDIQTASISGDYVLSFRKSHEFRAQLYSSLQEVKSNNYDVVKKQNDHRFTLRGSAGISGFSLMPSVHILLNNGNANAAGGLMISRGIINEKIIFRFTSGRSVRFPGMNDLYWVPGGNPDLMPEVSYQISAGAELRLLKRWRLMLSAGNGWINNWILWQPTQISSIWSPLNVRKVKTQTADFFNVVEMKFFSIDVTSIASYSYCISADVSDADAPEFGKQLIYVPHHMASHVAKLEFSSFSLSVESHYTGKRFTRSDNLSWMPAHFHHNVLLGWKKDKQKLSLEVFAGLYNATGENYQIIAWQPMPRRYFKVSVQISFYEN
jgi:vitamin B12 transporter